MSLEGWFTSYGNYLVYQPLCLPRQNLVLWQGGWWVGVKFAAVVGLAIQLSK